MTHQACYETGLLAGIIQVQNKINKKRAGDIVGGNLLPQPGTDSLPNHSMQCGRKSAEEPLCSAEAERQTERENIFRNDMKHKEDNRGHYKQSGFCPVL